jgi:hypothetical protein
MSKKLIFCEEEEERVVRLEEEEKSRKTDKKEEGGENIMEEKGEGKKFWDIFKEGSEEEDEKLTKTGLRDEKTERE